MDDRTRSRHHLGFWIVAVVFVLVMSYATVPTPLYPLYQELDGFPVAMITVIFAAFAAGVMLALYLAGHVSDWVGRRRVLLVAVLLSIVAAVIFLLWPETAGLLVARVIDGLSVGLLTATATAHLGELRAVARPGEGPALAASLAGAANIGGLALGPLIGGLFAEFLPAPLVLPHAVYLVLLVAAAGALLIVPETVTRPDELPAYRPQRLAVPEGGGRVFLLAGAAVFSGFAVFGLFTSLAPTFLAKTFDETDHLLAGIPPFAVFAAAAIGQVALAGLSLRRQLTVAVITCIAGLGLVAVGAVVPELIAFIVGGAIAGVGVGLLFKAATSTVLAVADPARRGGTLALLFLVAYTGLTVPVIAVGVALVSIPPVPVLLVFIALVLVGTTLAGLTMRRDAARAAASIAS